MINLAIIDGSRVFADALAVRLTAESDIRVVRCATGRVALRQALDHSSADVVLGDAALFDPEGRAPVTVVAPLARVPLAVVGSAVAARRPGPAVVLLADRCELGRLAACLRWGVRGWVPRSCSVDELLRAIRAVDDGGTWIPSKELTHVLDELVWSPPPDDPAQLLVASLTRREREVLTCLVDGLQRTEVATRLQLSTNTVRTHVQSILAKLGVNSCIAAVALVRRTALGTARSPALT